MGKFFYMLWAIIAAFVGGALTALIGRETGMDVPGAAIVTASAVAGLTEMGGYFAGYSDAGATLNKDYGMTVAAQAVGVVLGTLVAFFAFTH